MVRIQTVLSDAKSSPTVELRLTRFTSDRKAPPDTLLMDQCAHRGLRASLLWLRDCDKATLEWQEQSARPVLPRPGELAAVPFTWRLRMGRVHTDVKHD
jgi:hypothetical protein